MWYVSEKNPLTRINEDLNQGEDPQIVLTFFNFARWGDPACLEDKSDLVILIVV